ncbi:MAG: immunoglobulin domain-containing protein [Opitutaceae bacterium]|nr:immunoglobulin domain-containing protein [Opitutaceae bacterium]
MKTSLARSFLLGAALSLACSLVVPIVSADPASFAAGSRWWWGGHGERDAKGTPPVITDQPDSQIVAPGSDVTFTVVAVPDPDIQFVQPEPILYQWLFNGHPIDGATDATLVLEDVAFRHAGMYSVVVRWGPGWVRSLPATLSVASDSLVGVTGPASQLVDNGGDVTFAVTGGADALTYVWRFHGRARPVGTQSSLAIANAGTTAAGTYSVEVSDASGLLARYVATLRIHTDARLVNLSARGVVGTGAERMIVGLVIGGDGAKRVLLRGIGPTLGTKFGVANSLPDPTLTLNHRFGHKLEENLDWGGTPELVQAFTDVGAFQLPIDSADAALATTLEAGLYTAWVTGEDDGSGVALAEVYDADLEAPTTELVNLSARAWVGADEKVLAAGFVISGTTSNTVLIRGIGPTLSLKFGLPRALARTRIAIYRAGDRDAFITNEVWGDDEDVVETGELVGAFRLPPGLRDSAVIATLPPGAYTAVVSGVNREVGIALVEVYEVR